MGLDLVISDRFAEHVPPPGHPERPERAGVMREAALRRAMAGTLLLEPRAITRDELERVHAPDHLDRIAATAGRAVRIDADTYTSPASHEVALLAAGAVVGGVDRVLGDGGNSSGDERPRKVFALTRPPGHHAERGRAMGFCLYNNVACAAAHALALGARRVAIVDYDVHHGNGTQWIFYAEPRVLFVSTHQYPFYPGTGASYEVGVDEGEGYTLNVPLEVGATDADYDLVFSALVGPVLEDYSPDILLISAGFDAHERDPIAGMRMSVSGYAAIAAQLAGVADRCCGGRIVAACEGGYDLKALSASLDATFEALVANGARAAGKLAGSTERADRAISQVRAAQKPYWPRL
jgi:acetoin utilization deacetylase AcuC-like enzyme